MTAEETPPAPAAPRRSPGQFQPLARSYGIHLSKRTVQALRPGFEQLRSSAQPRRRDASARSSSSQRCYRWPAGDRRGLRRPRFKTPARGQVAGDRRCRYAPDPSHYRHAAGSERMVALSRARQPKTSSASDPDQSTSSGWREVHAPRRATRRLRATRPLGEAGDQDAETITCLDARSPERIANIASRSSWLAPRPVRLQNFGQPPMADRSSPIRY